MKRKSHNSGIDNVKKLSSFIGRNYRQLEGILNSIRKNAMSDESIRLLNFLGRHKDEHVRGTVVEIVGQRMRKLRKVDRDRLYPLLLAGLGDRNCRYGALDALRGHFRVNSIDMLGGILLQERDPLNRVQTADALISINHYSVIPYLVYALKDKDRLVRVYSAYGLALLNSKESIPVLTGMQRRERSMAVRTACWGGIAVINW